MDMPNEAQRLIESHISTLDEHKGQLERALAHLDGSAENQDKGRGRNRRKQGAGGGKGRRAGTGGGRGAQGMDGGENAPRGAQGRGGGKQAPRVARRKEVIADLEANPGSKAADIAGRVGINPNHAQTILANLVKQGIAVKDGPLFSAAAADA